jgi:hypothetical protein
LSYGKAGPEGGIEGNSIFGDGSSHDDLADILSIQFDVISDKYIFQFLFDLFAGGMDGMHGFAFSR